MYLESSWKKMEQLRDIRRRGNLARIESVRGEVWRCSPINLAEDEEDWAYDVKVLNDPAFEYLILEGCYIKSIEEVPQYLA